MPRQPRRRRRQAAARPVRTRDIPGLPSATQLGATLRSYVKAARALGAHHGWRPAPGSTSEAHWKQAGESPLARTLCEGEVHAILLTRSGLEHAAATARALSANDPFLPHSLGRTASEHLLRAHHHLDNDADPTELARRRLNEWLWAIHESDQRKRGLVRTDIIQPGTVGRDRDDLVEDVRQRATELGESLSTRRATAAPIVTGTEGRIAPMSLAERHTAGTALGVPSFTMRGHSALTHGNELALLACARDGEPDPNMGGIVLLQPTPMETGDLAFNLLGVVLTSINTIDAMKTRFGWPDDPKFTPAWVRAQERMTATWSDAINAEEVQ